MVNYVKTCKICQIIRKKEPKLFDRINNNGNHVPGGESILSIWNDIAPRHGLTNRQAMYNHAKKHQSPTKKQVEAARAGVALREIKGEGREIRKAEYTNHNDMRKRLLDAGLQALDDGDMKLTGNVMASLLRLEADIEEKQKDRSFEMMKMFNYFASGSNTNPSQKRYGSANMPVFEGEIVEESVPRERL